MPRRSPGSRTAFALAVMICLVTPTVASAQDDTVQRYLIAAARLYEGLEYERALEQLKRAKQIPTRTVDDDAAIALYEGVILADMGKKDESIAAFKEGLYLKPDAKLPVKVSPKVVADFEGVRADVKRELAPILAKQEAERKKREEEAKKLADAQRKAEEERIRADADAKRRAEAERARAEAEAKARKAAEERAKQQQQSDRPVDEGKDKIIVVRPDNVAPRDELVPGPEKKVQRGVPLAPIILGGIGVAAGGAGALFGLQSRSQLDQARAAQYHDDTARLRNSAADSALVANIAFAAAGAAAIGALISVFTGGEDAPPPVRRDDGAGAGSTE